MSWVYILKNDMGRYYIGSTTDLNQRLKHHQGGFTPTTKRLGNMQLVLAQGYETLKGARIIERRLKRLKRKDYLDKIVREGRIKMRV